MKEVGINGQIGERQVKVVLKAGTISVVPRFTKKGEKEDILYKMTTT